MATILVENHSLKPYDQRVLGTYVFLEHTLRVVARDAKVLQEPGLARASSGIETIRGLAAWTDDYNNLFRILK